MNLPFLFAKAHIFRDSDLTPDAKMRYIASIHICNKFIGFNKFDYLILSVMRNEVAYFDG